MSLKKVVHTFRWFKGDASLGSSETSRPGPRKNFDLLVSTFIEQASCAAKNTVTLA